MKTCNETCTLFSGDLKAWLDQPFAVVGIPPMFAIITKHHIETTASGPCRGFPHNLIIVAWERVGKAHIICIRVEGGILIKQRRVVLFMQVQLEIHVTNEVILELTHRT
mmetsp:Transcript_27629/g.57825  ORF Transcript_27629/g.57825 Transcript_27629/m.57825 type:complete len:109 (+) Transcript_27629:85-411(+)